MEWYEAPLTALELAEIEDKVTHGVGLGLFREGPAGTRMPLLVKLLRDYRRLSQPTACFPSEASSNRRFGAR